MSSSSLPLNDSRFSWYSQMWQSNQIDPLVEDPRLKSMRESLLTLQASLLRNTHSNFTAAAAWIKDKSDTGATNQAEIETLNFATSVRACDVWTAIIHGFASPPDLPPRPTRISLFDVQNDKQWNRFLPHLTNLETVFNKACAAAKNAQLPVKVDEKTDACSALFNCIKNAERLGDFAAFYHNFAWAAAHLHFLITYDWSNAFMPPAFNASPSYLREKVIDWHGCKPLYWALLVSPIVLLVNVRVINWRFSRMQLIKYLNDLPLVKPRILVDLEKLIWQSLFRIVEVPEKTKDVIGDILNALPSYLEHLERDVELATWFDTAPHLPKSPIISDLVPSQNTTDVKTPAQSTAALENFVKSVVAMVSSSSLGQETSQHPPSIDIPTVATSVDPSVLSIPPVAHLPLTRVSVQASALLEQPGLIRMKTPKPNSSEQQQPTEMDVLARLSQSQDPADASQRPPNKASLPGTRNDAITEQEDENPSTEDLASILNAAFDRNHTALEDSDDDDDNDPWPLVKPRPQENLLPSSRQPAGPPLLGPLENVSGNPLDEDPQVYPSAHHSVGPLEDNVAHPQISSTSHSLTNDGPDPLGDAIMEEDEGPPPQSASNSSGNNPLNPYDLRKSTRLNKGSTTIDIQPTPLPAPNTENAKGPKASRPTAQRPKPSSSMAGQKKKNLSNSMIRVSKETVPMSVDELVDSVAPLKTVQILRGDASQYMDDLDMKSLRPSGKPVKRFNVRMTVYDFASSQDVEFDFPCHTTAHAERIKAWVSSSRAYSRPHVDPPFKTIHMEALTSSQLPQDLLRTHCLIIKTSDKDQGFSLDTLANISDPYANTHLRDFSQKDDIVMGTTMDVYKEAALGDKGRIVHAISLPCATNLAPSNFFTDQQAWDMTRMTFISKPDHNMPLAQMNWGLLSLAGSHTAGHHDANGPITFVQSLTGRKLWFICIPKLPSTAHTISTTADPSGPLPPSDDWYTFAVILKPGVSLMLRPGVFHSVFTLDNAIFCGSQGYMTNNLFQTIMAMAVHLCYPYSTSSNYSSGAMLMLQRVIIYLHKLLVKNQVTPRDQRHMPDLKTDAGISNVLAACLIGISMMMFDPNAYDAVVGDTALTRSFIAQEVYAYTYVRGISMELLHFLFVKYDITLNNRKVSVDDVHHMMGAWIGRICYWSSLAETDANESDIFKIDLSVATALMQSHFSGPCLSTLKDACLQVFGDDNVSDDIRPFKPGWTLTPTSRKWEPMTETVLMSFGTGNHVLKPSTKQPKKK
ncbi:hypothetical protein BJ165DRAFT_1518126 [Panaeolus papilionaceus]|nr:hypothetical protein BJ165DRAFT_1518126 [Panaeolus papilionaceus]